MNKSACLMASAVFGIAAVVAGCSSSGNSASLASSGGSGPTHMSGTEIFTAGTTSLTVIGSNVQKLPLRALGAFTDAGYITIQTGANAADKVITFPDGTIKLTSTSRSTPKQGVNSTNCRAHESLTGGTYKIIGGTGKYAGITGSGTADVTVTATLPRTKDGKCNMARTVQPTSAQETIAAHGPIKLG